MKFDSFMVLHSSLPEYVLSFPAKAAALRVGRNSRAIESDFG
jgi:hypothetical protein